MAKLLTVIGASGIQGGSVIDAVSKANTDWKIRAITRNPNSEAARGLAAKGIEVLQADLEDVEFLKNAFAGTQAIFAVTDFFAPFAVLDANAEKAIEVEWRQCENIIEAASDCTNLQHFVWSTLPNVAKISNGKYRVPHFVAKNCAEEAIKANFNLWKKTSFLWVGWYGSNFQYPLFKPTLLVRYSVLYTSAIIEN